MTKITLQLRGHYYNHWPHLRIQIDNTEYYNNIVQDNIIDIEFDNQSPSKHILSLQHYKKQFGENGIYDTEPSSGEDCKITIQDIKFDGVTIGEHRRSLLEFKNDWSTMQLANNSNEFISQYTQFPCHGIMSFNGRIDLEFETPIYNWLTLFKYKTPAQKNTAYFSGHDMRWNYEEDLALIKEIKDLIKID